MHPSDTEMGMVFLLKYSFAPRKYERYLSQTNSNRTSVKTRSLSIILAAISLFLFMACGASTYLLLLPLDSLTLQTLSSV